MAIGRELRLAFRSFVHFIKRRVPDRKKCSPSDTSDQYYIQLVADWNKLEVEQLNRNPKAVEKKEKKAKPGEYRPSKTDFIF
jgi:hypothetical protein